MKFVSLLLILCLLPAAAGAENNLTLTKKDGSKRYAPIGLVRSVTFDDSGSVMRIHLRTGADVSEPLSTIRTITFDTTASGVLLAVSPAPGTVPAAFRLLQNYPNPFNPATAIGFEIPERSVVSLRIYNVLGQLVASLMEGEKAPGRYSVTFDAGQNASGVYFCRLTVGTQSVCKKMLLAR